MTNALTTMSMHWWVGIVGALLTFALPSQSWGQERHQFSYSLPPTESKYVQQLSIDVGDVPGHRVRVVEIQRTYAVNHPVLMGVKVVESWRRGTTDYVNGVGPVQLYDVWVLEDGNRVFLEYRGLTVSQATAAGYSKGVSHATVRIVGGTGKFKGVRGMLTDETQFDSDPKTGYNKSVLQGDYWFQE